MYAIRSYYVTNADVNIWNELMTAMIRLKYMIGESIGKVILKNCTNLFAPSTPDASYRSDGICFNPARKITIVEPNCHTLSRTSVPSAVSGFVIQPFPAMPNTAISYNFV